MAETVNHPPHYNVGKIEVIDAIEDWGLGFCDGNVVKYVARFRHKHGIEDLKKARWYLNRLIETEEKNSVRSKSDSGQSGTVRKTADDDNGDVSKVHTFGSADASGQGEEFGKQSSDSVVQNEADDNRRSGDSPHVW